MAKEHPEKQYLNLLQDIMDNGFEKKEFNSGIALKSVFGRQIRFDLSQGFPLLTTKKVFIRGIIEELLWFISGDSNIKYLVDRDIHIWDDWAFKNYNKNREKDGREEYTQDDFIKRIKEDVDFASKWGELGPVYGRQWRRWPTSDGREVDQLAWAIMKTRKYPDRKHVVVSAWNPEFVYEMASPDSPIMAIPPCHTIFNINVTNNKLSLGLYQRSADMFLGVPFNIASYSLLTMMLAQVCGYEPGEFVHTFGDSHIYGNHYDQVNEQIAREPKPFPVMKLNPEIKEIDDFRYDDFELVGYDPHPPIKGEITVVGGFNEKDRIEFNKKRC
ncbi:thymidylate synthase [Candidatus Campbellbacteria bacterium CG22_combo_CG10-13_8_21_14_all_36_13]|uniref:Thymidylate synthase n=1 Tax=Candidatus Campbellbacteria bacterium CG22_combo_CG10-13_8_21_14_all_36_13 TaxID=1974529 RepID=A0A2H0DZ70_9BACT|nr:MAG: thymidylate synthase [Candidatus Campbellbacteria bacterium CG22_combo_CG10-13_8_21_14_all_36_13]